MCTENRSIHDNYFDLQDFIYVADAMKKRYTDCSLAFQPLRTGNRRQCQCNNIVDSDSGIYQKSNICVNSIALAHPLA